MSGLSTAVHFLSSKKGSSYYLIVLNSLERSARIKSYNRQGLDQALNDYKNWELTTTSTEKPDGGLMIVSMLHQSDGIRYRLVGENKPADASDVVVKPGLEDGYIWLMHMNTEAI